MKSKFKSFRVFVFSLFLIALIPYGLQKFFIYKVNKEYPRYSYELEELQIINDAYIACIGIASENPTEINLRTCEKLKLRLEHHTKSIAAQYPYIGFYIKYIQKPQAN